MLRFVIPAIALMIFPTLPAAATRPACLDTLISVQQPDFTINQIENNKYSDGGISWVTAVFKNNSEFPIIGMRAHIELWAPERPVSLAASSFDGLDEISSGLLPNESIEVSGILIIGKRDWEFAKQAEKLELRIVLINVVDADYRQFKSTNRVLIHGRSNEYLTCPVV